MQEFNCPAILTRSCSLSGDNDNRERHSDDARELSHGADERVQANGSPIGEICAIRVEVESDDASPCGANQQRGDEDAGRNSEAVRHAGDDEVHNVEDHEVHNFEVVQLRVVEVLQQMDGRADLKNT